MASYLLPIASQFASRSSIPLIRASGAVASLLLCVHSVSYLFSPSHSLFRFVHNFADLLLFLAFGLSGLVAEVFPRDSILHKTLKSNFPFLNSLVGRGVFYVIFGMIIMGNYGGVVGAVGSVNSTDDGPGNFWGYFCVGSGLYMCSVGVVLLVNAVRHSGARSLVPTELSQPIVAFVPSIVTPGETLERAPMDTRSISPFPTAV